MAAPIATTSGVCFAFPDILKTPSPSGLVPMPYPNVAQLSDAQETATNVKADGRPVIHEGSRIDHSTGGEAGTGFGTVSGKANAACTFVGHSATVKVNGKGVVRQGDATEQNDGNVSGTVLTGVPTVLVGG